jgi:hypothetical protein
VQQHRGTGRNSHYMSRIVVSLPTMDVSLVRTRMDDGRLDPARQRLTSERMKEGMVGRPDLVADAGEGNGGSRSGRRRRHCVPIRHGHET